MEVSSQLAPWRNPELREFVIRPYYRSSDAMPGHPWDHALMVRNVARAKAIKAIAYHDMRLNLDVIELGTLTHDAHVWKEPGIDYHCCPTKEQHSAHLDRTEIFPRLHTPTAIAEHALHVVLTTERDVRCENDNEAKCGCQGDMWSVISEDPRDILLGTVNFFKEKRILAGNPLDGPIPLDELTEFAAGSYDYLQGFIEEELSLGAWDRDSDGLTMSQRGHINVEQLRPDRFPNLMRSLFPRLLAVA